MAVSIFVIRERVRTRIIFLMQDGVVLPRITSSLGEIDQRDDVKVGFSRRIIDRVVHQISTRKDLNVNIGEDVPKISV